MEQKRPDLAAHIFLAFHREKRIVLFKKHLRISSRTVFYEEIIDFFIERLLRFKKARQMENRIRYNALISLDFRLAFLF